MNTHAHTCILACMHTHCVCLSHTVCVSHTHTTRKARLEAAYTHRDVSYANRMLLLDAAHVRVPYAERMTQLYSTHIRATYAKACGTIKRCAHSCAIPGACSAVDCILTAQAQQHLHMVPKRISHCNPPNARFCGTVHQGRQREKTQI